MKWRRLLKSVAAWSLVAVTAGVVWFSACLCLGIVGRAVWVHTEGYLSEAGEFFGAIFLRPEMHYHYQSPWVFRLPAAALGAFCVLAVVLDYRGVHISKAGFLAFYLAVVFSVVLMGVAGFLGILA